MNETMMGVVLGFSVLSIATLFVVAHYRREHLRQRLIRSMHGQLLHEFTRSRYWRTVGRDGRQRHQVSADIVFFKPPDEPVPVDVGRTYRGAEHDENGRHRNGQH